jgi:hypothetical protein
LIKAWEYSEAMENFELGIEILFLVFLVCERVETNSIGVIWSKVSQFHLVLTNFGKIFFNRDNLILEIRSGIQGSTVYIQVGYS